MQRASSRTTRERDRRSNNETATTAPVLLWGGKRKQNPSSSQIIDQAQRSFLVNSPRLPTRNCASEQFVDVTAAHSSACDFQRTRISVKLSSFSGTSAGAAAISSTAHANPTKERKGNTRKTGPTSTDA
eukprot:6197994-Pleurochrysis_carterae.AAC.3